MVYYKSIETNNKFKGADKNVRNYSS
jgi:hypothetical protein